MLDESKVLNMRGKMRWRILSTEKWEVGEVGVVGGGGRNYTLLCAERRHVPQNHVTHAKTQSLSNLVNINRSGAISRHAILCKNTYLYFENTLQQRLPMTIQKCL